MKARGCEGAPGEHTHGPRPQPTRSACFQPDNCLARSHDQQLLAANLHFSLGELSLQRKEPLRAVEAFEEASAMFHELGSPMEATTLELLGDARATMNDMALAREAYDAALALTRDLEDPARKGSLLTKRATARNQSGDADGALQDLEEARHLQDALSAP